MMTKIDRRITNTQGDIKQAFISLMQEKSFDSLTVKDLSERANINRTTFYKHFLDKFDLLEKYEGEILRNVTNIIRKIETSYIENPKKEDTNFRYLIQIYEYFNQEHELITLLLGPNGDPTFQESIRQMLIQIYQTMLDEVIDPEDLHFPLDLVIMYVSSAHLGILRYWLENETGQSPQDMADLLFEMMMKGPFKASGLDKLLNRDKR
jgi:AcrR family transcriptional regulator